MFRRRHIWHPYMTYSMYIYVVRRNHLITFTSYVIHLCLSWFMLRGRKRVGLGLRGGKGVSWMIGISSAQLKPPYSLEFYKFTHFIDYEMPLVGKLVATKWHIRKSTERVKVRFGSKQRSMNWFVFLGAVGVILGLWDIYRLGRAAFISFIFFFFFIFYISYLSTS